MFVRREGGSSQPGAETVARPAATGINFNKMY